MIISFSCGLFFTGQSIGWQFERISPTTWNIKAGIIGLSFGWLIIGEEGEREQDERN